jgi:hypothetical protein
VKEDEQGNDSVSKLKVPFICQFMPLRWSYEAMLISQARLNPLTRAQDQLEARIQQIVEKPGELTEKERQTLDLTKQALAVVSGLQAKDPDDVPKHLQNVREHAIDGTLTQELLDYVQREKRATSAEELYINRKVLDLVTKAEMEREDYRRERSPNVFFGTNRKYTFVKWTRDAETLRNHSSWLGFYIAQYEIPTIWLNGFVIIFSLVIIITAVQFSLKRQLTRV